MLEMADQDQTPIFCGVEDKLQSKFLLSLGFEEKKYVKSKLTLPFWIFVREPRKLLLNNSNPLVSSPTIYLKDITVGKSLGSGVSGNVFQGLWLETTLVAMKLFKDKKQFQHEESLLR